MPVSNLNEILEIYELMSSSVVNIVSRKQSIALRKKALLEFLIPNNLVKVAFDTRRIDEEITYNPRRGLQNYHRSEPFISANMLSKIKAFSKLAKVLNQLKLEYERRPAWQDSYVRILTSAINKGLRTLQKDGDFSDAQPSMASLDYLEELLHVRYRLTPDLLMTMSEKDLRQSILSKDEFLVNDQIMGTPSITPSDVSKFSYEQMMDKMIHNSIPSDISKFSYEQMMEKTMLIMAQVISQIKTQDSLVNKLFDVKTDPNNLQTERTVTINIKDQVNNSLEENSSGG